MNPSQTDAKPSPAPSAQSKPKPESNGLRRFLKTLGPGLITGASDDDPSGIGTYAATGAQLGYAPLWTALVTFPLMASIQFTCAKIGLVSGRGIAGVLREYYPRALLYPIIIALMAANTINAGADLLAVAAGLNLLIPIPTGPTVVVVALLILAFQIWGSYAQIARVFKWLTLTLFAYIGAALFARPDWAQVLRGTFVPTIHLDSKFLATLVAILGTTISPYLFFWQASQEVEEQVARNGKKLWRRKGISEAELGYAFWDVSLGMFVSNVVMYFIILASAATLHEAGRTDIDSAADAAEALRPLAGNAATVLMALALIGTGLLTVPILTASAASAVCEAFGWTCSLNAKPAKAKEFYIVLSLATLGGLALDFTSISPIDALFWTAVLNGFLAPPLLVVIMWIGNNPAIMGQRVNRRWENILGWTTTGAMFGAAVGLVITWGKT